MRRTDVHYDIPFGDFTARSTLYEIDVTGYQGKCGRLRLFDVDTADERLIKSGIGFDARDVARGLTLFLYPDDSTEQGRLLRVYQEYFMVANAARLILDECVARGSDLHDLADYAAIQINDTHPTLVIPELIRLLQERGIGEDEAVSIVRSVCAYTNHTILAEALEKWPRAYLEKVAPQLMPVIDRLDARVCAKYDDPFVQIIDEQGNVRMANLDIHFTHSVNGVAKLHTEILKNSELAPFYAIYPEKFNNKTNGITFRRWLMAARAHRRCGAAHLPRRDQAGQQAALRRLAAGAPGYRHRPGQRVRCAVEAPPRVQAPAAEPAVVRAHAAGHPRGHPP